MTPEEFTTVVSTYADVVRAYISRRGTGLDVGVSNVDDIAADVWAVAWSKRSAAPALEQSDVMRAWLLQIARLTLANHIRKTVARRQWGVSEMDIAVASTEHIVLADEDLRRGFAALTPAEKEVFALTVWEGLKPAEIAEVLGISANAASLRLFKARTKITEILTERN
jgi:RNA polymerase sigma-70 factor (ECF subfamily)